MRPTVSDPLLTFFSCIVPPDGYQPAVSVLLLEIKIVSESSLSIVDNVFADSSDVS